MRFRSSVSIDWSAMVTGVPSDLWSGLKVSFPNQLSASLAHGMVLAAANARRCWSSSVGGAVVMRVVLSVRV